MYLVPLDGNRNLADEVILLGGPQALWAWEDPSGSDFFPAGDCYVKDEKSAERANRADARKSIPANEAIVLWSRASTPWAQDCVRLLTLKPCIAGKSFEIEQVLELGIESAMLSMLK